MPKQRITREMVIQAAFELARAGGMEQVMVKNIAAELGCSVQPIYTYCKNMSELRRDVTEQANTFIKEFLAAHIDKKDFFRSTGYAYLELAREEPHIFQIFILHQREGIASLDDLYRTQATPSMAGFIASAHNISTAKARQLHLNMLIYTIGIGTILATTGTGLPPDEVSSKLEEAYQAFLHHAAD